jgi:probable F420-dependent oxidoreductase
MAGHPFRFGIIAETFQDRRQWFELARRAEALGYDTLLVRDHLAPDYFGPQFAPMVALASLAAVTTELRFGNFVIDNDFRHPTILAKEATTLDVLTNGRYELGIGAGWLRNEYDQAGLSFDPNSVRVDRLEESLQILKSCFSQETVSFAGEHYRLCDHHHFPEPAQPGGPPIMIGAGKPRMLRLAGRYADIVSLLTVQVSSGRMVEDVAGRRTAAIQDQIALIADGAGERLGRVELSMGPLIEIAEKPVESAQRLIEANGWRGATFDDVGDMPGIFIGPVDEICDQMIQRREELGISYFIIPDRQLDDVAPIVARLRGR